MWGHIWHRQYISKEIWGNIAADDMFDQIINAIDADVVRYIHVTRRDRLRQAVSEIRAGTIDRWGCPAWETPQHVAIPFTDEAINRVEFLIEQYPKYDVLWDDYFETRGINPLRLVYEDMTTSVATIHKTFWQTAGYIGASVPLEYRVTIPLRKQAGADVENWIAQYECR